MEARGIKQVVIYAAKSTADEKGSIPTQLTEARKRAEHEGLQVAGQYKDEAKSAYHGSRGRGLAEAKEHAERIAPCALIVQHSDRLARGDAVRGQHLVEVALWALKAGVTIISIQDPRACESIVDAALMGSRNYEDSERKSAATKLGLRRTIERGEWRGGVLPEGYGVVRSVDERGRTSVRVIKDADDEATIDFVFSLYREGRS